MPSRTRTSARLNSNDTCSNGSSNPQAAAIAGDAVRDAKRYKSAPGNSATTTLSSGETSVENKVTSSFSLISTVLNKKRGRVSESTSVESGGQSISPNSSSVSSSGCTSIGANSSSTSTSIESVEDAAVTPQPLHSSKQQTVLPFDDIDDVEISDKYDPTYCRSIHRYTLSQEVVIRDSVFGKGRMQEELNDTMRIMLVDWLVTVVDEYSLSNTTLHLAVQLVDRCLRLIPIRSQSFQLVGCTCLLIAAKLDEVQPPLTSHLVTISDNAFTISSIVQMEQTLLNLLDFNIVIPTRTTFARRFALAADMIPREASFLNLLLELTLLDYNMNRFMSSLVAAACVHYTLQVFRPLRSLIWTKKLRHYTGYEETQLREVVCIVQDIHEQIEESGWKNSLRKYATTEHHVVSYTTAVRKRDLRFDSNSCSD